MAISIFMPALSPTMEHGKLARWLVKEGERVTPGDVIAEIETDKATMEVEATDEGIMAKILVPEGTGEVAVGTPIAVLAEEGEDAGSVEVPAAMQGAAPAQADGPSAQEGAAGGAARETAGAGRMPAEQSAKAAGGAGRMPVADNAAPAGGRIFATPLARRLAKEAGLELARITGSGPHGRIVKADVEKAIAQGTPKGAQAEASGAAMADVSRLYEAGTYDLEPLDSMRKVIAERLTHAKQSIPHFYLTVECVIDKLLAARSALNAGVPQDANGAPVWKISVNDFIIKAWAMALMRVPKANATWSDAGILVHHHADVAVAVATPGGLITPIIRHAEEKGLAAISSEMKELAQKARARKLLPEDYEGGSSAISNLGMYGISEFSAVINPPHATILAIGAGRPQPVAENGEVVIRTVMKATLSVDHRAVDGALGAQALSAFKALIEEPALMLA